MRWLRAMLIALAGTLAVLMSGDARAHVLSDPDQAPGRRPNEYVPPGQFEPGASNTPPELIDVGVDESLDAKLPLDTTFKDQTGKTVKLGDYVDGKRPTLLVFAYHTCPTICSLIQTNVTAAMKGVDWTAGQEYQAVTISIDPREGPAQASAKRADLLAQYGRPVDGEGWAFLTGDDAAIHEVAKHAGWRYFYDERKNMYAHPSAVVLLKPNGRVARYIYGLDFSPRDLRLGLLEASEYKSISTFDRVVLYCYQYDGHQRRYTLVATRVMQIGGVITALVLGAVLTRLWMRERRGGGGGDSKRGGGDGPRQDHKDPTRDSSLRAWTNA